MFEDPYKNERVNVDERLRCACLEIERNKTEDDGGGERPVNIIKIIKLGLEQSGYNGLVYPGICGCENNDLSPGACLSDSCEPGYKHTHSISKAWIISTDSKPISDAVIQRIINDCS
jgi:hypothetical protein